VPGQSVNRVNCAFANGSAGGAVTPRLTFHVDTVPRTTSAAAPATIAVCHHRHTAGLLVTG
jgi:hypothetical protein